MSYCLNPGCPKPENPVDVDSCQSCGLPLLLKERYRAIKPIGQGGFGKTFLAVDEDMPSKRQCVIKQFFNQSGLKAQKAKELFVQEAVQLEKLGKQHPQIPELFAHVELGIGLFLVQEFIDGQHLLQELKQEGTFDEDKIWQLLNDLIPVLHFIHNQQVIHRDIKPENIIRRQIDGQPVLVDFGVSKFATETALERTGTVIGSRGYAAPEQSEGKAYFSSDLFGLGRTCFHLLTNTEPKKVFSQYGNWEKYLRIHLNKSGISDALKHILTKLLQSDISQRYQSAEEVLKDLDIQQAQIHFQPHPSFPTFQPSAVETDYSQPQEQLSGGKLTPRRYYYLAILKALDEQGGSAKVKDVLVQVEQLMKGVLKEIDYQPRRSESDRPRWYNATMDARYQLKEKGFLRKDSPQKIWEISEAGRKFLAEETAKNLWQMH
jgi:serine/threonine protein kinase